MYAPHTDDTTVLPCSPLFLLYTDRGVLCPYTIINTGCSPDKITELITMPRPLPNSPIRQPVKQPPPSQPPPNPTPSASQALPKTAPPQTSAPPFTLPSSQASFPSVLGASKPPGQPPGYPGGGLGLTAGAGLSSLGGQRPPFGPGGLGVGQVPPPQMRPGGLLGQSGGMLPGSLSGLVLVHLWEAQLHRAVGHLHCPPLLSRLPLASL